MNRKTKLRLLKNAKVCFWCKIPVVYISDKPKGYTFPNNMATIDHVFGKLHPGRLTDNKVVVSCHKCNKERGRLDQLFYGQYSQAKRKDEDIPILVKRVLKGK